MVQSAAKAVADGSGTEIAENETSIGLEGKSGHMAEFESTLRPIRSQSAILPKEVGNASDDTKDLSSSRNKKKRSFPSGNLAKMCKAGNVPDAESTVIEPTEVWKRVSPPINLKASEKLLGW